MDKIQLTKCFGIYRIKCSVDSKFYIGSTTKSFSIRWKRWRSDLKRGKGNAHLRNAWKLYGEDAFEFSIIEIIEDKEKVLEREQHYIDTLKPEYNFMKIAGAPKPDRITSEDTKEKLRNKVPWNKGKKGEYSLGPHTEESKEKMRQKALGKAHSQETKEKISEKSKGRVSPNKEKPILPHVKEALRKSRKKQIGENHPMFGKTHSEEARKKISEANKGKQVGADNPFFGKTHTQEVREKLRLINLKNEPHAISFKIISPTGKIYEGTNLNKFCREHSLQPSSMSLVRQGKQSSHKGWKFL